ncbi:MAG TPA: DUF1572 family protein [Bacteroidia bacterium]|nr:DUF1572 family protein [Bacteroidia bacterium]
MDANHYLETTKKTFLQYKKMAEAAMAQLSDEQISWAPSPESNSIAVIVKHLWGNMLSRWTNFLTTDGEKDSRDRDAEFEATDISTRTQLMEKWEEGWKCFIDCSNSLKPEDLDKVVKIRGEDHTVIQALQRQLAHYSSHIGQIVYLAKMQKDKDWETLSIPKGQSKQFNANMMGNKK